MKEEDKQKTKEEDKSKEELKKVKMTPVNHMIMELEDYIVENDGKSDNGTTAKAILAERKMFLNFLKNYVKNK